MSGLIDYYNGYNEEQRTKRTRVHQIEFLTNIELMSRYIPKKSKILDVGAGTGVYSFHFTREGHDVTALDVVPKHVEEMKQKLLDSGGLENLTVGVGNALDLSRFENETFDAVVCFGPIYHLREPDDRKRCVSECLRVLKPGGILCIAYINSNYLVPMSYRFGFPLDESDITQLFNTGNVTGKEVEDFLSFSHFDTPDTIEAMMLEFEVDRLAHAGSEGIAHFISDQINDLSDEEFDDWLNYHFKTCTERTLLGISNHGIYIVSKL